MDELFTIETDIIYDANIFTLDIPHDNNIPIIGLSEFSDKPSRPSKSFIDTELYKKLINIKDKITLCQKWEKWAKLTNPYEKLSSIVKNKNYNKDYYKMYEIIKYFDLDKKIAKEGVKSLHLFDSKNFANAVLNFNKNIETNYMYSVNDGASSTDLLNYEATISEETISEDIMSLKVDIITGNGNVDVKHDPNNQEQLNLYNMFCQIVVALNNQKNNGVFIFKIFDTLTRPTCQLIYYLSKFYDVSIIKPRTTRLTNSEKFVVAYNFRSIDVDELKKINEIKWNQEDYCRTFNIEIPESIEKRLCEFNTLLVNIQISYIEKNMYYSYKDDTIVENQFDAFQNKKASDLCNLLDISNSSNNYVCKHIKRSKVNYQHLDLNLCDKCFCLLAK